MDFGTYISELVSLHEHAHIWPKSNMLISALIYVPKSSNTPMSIFMRTLNFGVYIRVLMSILDLVYKLACLSLEHAHKSYIPKSSNMLMSGHIAFHRSERA